MGEGARDDPRPGVVRATGQERSELRPGAPAPASPSRGENGKRGSVAGAVALIVGTSIGSGILAVPQRTAPAVSLRSGLLHFQILNFTLHFHHINL
jgi:hypothetical protein